MAVVLDTLQSPRPRHPEKVRRPETPLLRKPPWIRVKAPGSAGYAETVRIIRANGLHTVCEEAGCPNIGECWERKHATFMVMGDTCTRACAFCNVRTGLPRPLDPAEPARAAETVVAAKPDVFNHNLETVPSKYLTVRPGARYFASIRLLQRVKELDPAMFSKSGIMVGLGEERNEILQVMDDLRAADVDFLTIGQYLQPTRKHHPVERFVPPDEFKAYETVAYAKGFLMVSASPLTRSSHHAGEDFARLKAARDARSR